MIARWLRGSARLGPRYRRTVRRIRGPGQLGPAIGVQARRVPAKGRGQASGITGGDRAGHLAVVHCPVTDISARSAPSDLHGPF